MRRYPLDSTTHRGHRPHRRSGTLYVGVMMTALIVAMVGLSGLSVAHLGIRSSQSVRDSESAAMLARSAVEEGIRQLAGNSSWRTTFANNVAYPTTAISQNGGTLTWKYVDLDGSLNNNTADGVRVYGIGQAGKATYVESVLLLPTDAAVTSLGASFHCAGNVTLSSFSTLTTQQFISSNGSITATAVPSQIVGSAQAAGTVTGSVTLMSTSGVASRQMPGNTAFDYYLANGTPIDITKLPTSGGNFQINNNVLAPGINPFGSSGNVEGIYVIDCLGQNLTIGNSRIIGTLVIINPGSTCEFNNSINWSPVSPNFPAILVRGNAQFNVSQALLDESSLSTNFNPTGAPYSGVTDTNTTGQYRSTIKGLVYVSATLSFSTNPLAATYFDGSVVCTTFQDNALGNAKISYRPTHLDYPPPGFAAGSLMQIAPGTWKRSALP